MNKNSKIWVAGHNGLVGSAVVKKLKEDGYTNIITSDRQKYDLTQQTDVRLFFEIHRPEYVFMCAAKVGGIYANNTYSADFIHENLLVQDNIIHNAYVYKVKKLLFLGSSCIYPKYTPQPMKEDYLLSGYLESTNKPYAIAKIAGIIQCQAYNKQYGTNFISVMPTNLYGSLKDNYNEKNSHVMAAMLRKFYLAIKNQSPEIEIWGTGKPMREFLHVDDLADGLLFLMLNYNDSEIINLGTEVEISIKDLALLIKEISNYQGEIKFNEEYPDGTMQKFMDSSKIHNLGWHHKISLKEGLTDIWEQIMLKGIL